MGKFRRLSRKVFSLSIACLLVNIGFMGISSAEITSYKMYTLSDGTGPFTNNDPGNDGGQHNEIIRTHDSIFYRVVVQTNGSDTNLMLHFTLPTISGSSVTTDNGSAAAARWRQIPPQCMPAPTSHLSPDGRVLSCAMGDYPNISTFSLEPIAIVSGRAPNGQEIDFTSVFGPGMGSSVGRSYANSDETPADVYAVFHDTDIVLGAPEEGMVAADSILDQTVSATPKFDLMLGDTLSGDSVASRGAVASVFNSNSGLANEDGLSLAYGVFIYSRELMGSEMLDVDSPFSIVHTLAPSVSDPISQAALDEARLISWSGPTGSQLQNLNPGCANGALNNYYMPRDLGDVDSLDVGTVANGGLVSCTQVSKGDDVTISTDNTLDSSLTHFPTNLGVGGGTNPTSNNEWYIMSKRVAQYIPTSFLPAVGTLFGVDACIDFSALPKSISGQTNLDPNPFTDNQDSVGGTNDLSNHCRTSYFRRAVGGGANKKYVPSKAVVVPIDAQADERLLGDVRVNIVSPGQKYRSRVIIANSDSETFNYIACEKIDNSRQVVVKGSLANSLDELVLAPVSNLPTAATIEWGVQVGDGSGGISDSWGQYINANTEALGGDEFLEINNPLLGSTTLFETSSCPDSDVTGNTSGAPTAYFPNLDDVTTAGYTLDQVTMVRIQGALGAGQSIQHYIGMQLRTNFKYDASDVFLTPAGANLNYSAGDAIPMGSHIPNIVSFAYPANGFVANQNARDVIQAGNEHFLRVDKSANPASGTDVAPGQTINYIVSANYTTPSLGVPADVVVTDVLPPGMTYLATTSGPTPVISLNTPAAGFTTLDWTMQNVTPATANIGAVLGDLPDVTYTARVNTDLVTGNLIYNWVTVSDGGLDSGSEVDCTYDAAFDSTVGYSQCLPSYSTLPVKADNTVHTVSAPQGFQLFKEVINPEIFTGSLFTHRINWASIGVNTNNLRVIDVLPFDADARGSSFSGTLALQSTAPNVSLLGATHTIYYTKSPTINSDPNHVSNVLGTAPGPGVTVWCDVGVDATTLDVGADPECPTTIGESTGVSVAQTSALVAGVTYSLDLTLLTAGNAQNDVYANNHTANNSTSTLGLLTGNTVLTRVVESSVGDTVWYDYNKNGVKDAGEPGITGAILRLTGTDINGMAVDITTASGVGGIYLFNNLFPSDATGYSISITSGIPAGYNPSFDLDDGIVGADGTSGNFVLNINDDKLDVDFGYAQSGSITVNKTVVGTASTNSWAFALSSQEVGCVIPVSVTNPANTPSGASGQTTFSNLPLNSSTSGNACTYTVQETTQPGWNLTGLSCTAAGSISNAPGANVSGITLANPVTCSFENTATVDVSVNKVLTVAAPFSAGESVVYSITVTNNGPGVATNIVVADTMTNLSPAALIAPSCVPTTFPCTIPTLASGASEVISVAATIMAIGAFDNSVTVTPAETDTDPTNNTDNTGNGGTTSSVDVSVNKVLTSTGPYNTGDTVTYTMTIANAGPGTANGVVVSDTMTNLNFVSVTGGTCAPASFPCTIPSLLAGNNQVLTVTATIAAIGGFDNSVTVTTAETDTDPTNNTDNTGNGGTTSSVDVSVNKVLATAGPFNAGDNVVYTITIANAGPSVATDIVVSDIMTNLNLVSITGGTCAPASFPCTIPTLNNGASEVLTVVAEIVAPGTFDNSVTVSPKETDTVAGNNIDNTGNSGATIALMIPVLNIASLLTMLLLIMFGGVLVLNKQRIY